MTEGGRRIRDALGVVFLRELRTLDREIDAYPDDESLWVSPPGISNSAGALAQHLTGNLRHFVGTVLGGTGYVRDREAEFAARGRSRTELRAEVQRTIDDIAATLASLTPGQMMAEYPVRVQDRRIRTGDFLVHLSAHLSYHLGQIDYHRRLLTSATESVAALSVSDLPEYE
jgi:uncharacterized damage-inducible protein DinB